MKKIISSLLLILSFTLAPLAFAGGDEYESPYVADGCEDQGWDDCLEQTPQDPPNK